MKWLKCCDARVVVYRQVMPKFDHRVHVNVRHKVLTTITPGAEDMFNPIYWHIRTCVEKELER